MGVAPRITCFTGWAMISSLPNPFCTEQTAAELPKMCDLLGIASRVQSYSEIRGIADFQSRVVDRAYMAFGHLIGVNLGISEASQCGAKTLPSAPQPTMQTVQACGAHSGSHSIGSQFDDRYPDDMPFALIAGQFASLELN
jgi:hypothetical protein